MSKLISDYKKTKSPDISRRGWIHIGNLLFMLPAFFFLAAVVLIPFIQGIPYSFTNWKSIISENFSFIGFKNYIILLTNRYFMQTFSHTFLYTVLTIVIVNILALSLSLLLQRSTRFNKFARTVVFMPFVVSLIAAAIVWSYVYIDVYSAIFNVISPLGLSDQVIYGMAVIGVWRDVGYCMLIFIAALQAIPQDYYEASRIDGANRWQQFWKITLPLIVPAFTANITLLLAWGLKLFDTPMAIARNMEAAQTTSMYIYDTIFSNSKAGLGQAAAIIVTIVLVVLTNILTRVLRKREVEA